MSNTGPVRVGRFEWERLMMMSDLPKEDRFKLLAFAIFMDASGGGARPGNSNLALFGHHAETWKQLLRRAVQLGWLILVQRGGARRGPGGATIRRASVYAASVPLAVWERREEILGSLPFRSPGVEGSPEPASDPLKEASGAAPAGPHAMKEAPDTSFDASGRTLKEAPRDFLPNPLKEAPSGFEGSVQRFEGSPQRLPHHAVTTTHLHHPAAETVEGSLPEEGGGGGRQRDSEQLRAAASFVASLDYRGKTPRRDQRDRLIKLVDAALTTGWPETELRDYLDLGNGRADSPASIYLFRLRPDKLPEPPEQRPAPQSNPKCDECDEVGWRHGFNPDGDPIAYRCPCRLPNAA